MMEGVFAGLLTMAFFSFTHAGRGKTGWGGACELLLLWSGLVKNYMHRCVYVCAEVWVFGICVTLRDWGMVDTGIHSYLHDRGSMPISDPSLIGHG